jgi:hypothetical protein
MKAAGQEKKSTSKKAEMKSGDYEDMVGARLEEDISSLRGQARTVSKQDGTEHSPFFTRETRAYLFEHRLSEIENAL